MCQYGNPVTTSPTETLVLCLSPLSPNLAALTPQKTPSSASGYCCARASFPTSRYSGLFYPRQNDRAETEVRGSGNADKSFPRESVLLKSVIAELERTAVLGHVTDELLGGTLRQLSPDFEPDLDGHPEEGFP